jgi:flagellar biosynthesis/type III secretory pathway protein FliH
MYDDYEGKVTELCLDIVKKVINPAEEALGNVFQSLILNAIKQIKLTDKIIIRVGPAEYERFFSNGNAVFDLHSGVTVTATVLKDMSFNDGDCVIDTDYETINAGLDSQLRLISLAFERK